MKRLIVIFCAIALFAHAEETPIRFGIARTNDYFYSSESVDRLIGSASPGDYFNVSNKAYTALQSETDPTIAATNEVFAAAVRAVALSPSPDQSDVSEIGEYGTYGTVGAAILALIAGLAAMKRRAFSDAEVDAMAQMFHMDTDLANATTSQDVAIKKLSDLLGEDVTQPETT